MARYDQIGLASLIQPRVSIGQREIGMPKSPVARLFGVPQVAPLGPALYQAPPIERLPEQVALDPSVIRRPVSPFFQQVDSLRMPVLGTEGYTGPGTYRVVAPGGLRTAIVDVRSSTGTSPVPNTPVGTLVEVQADAGRYLNSGWLPIVSPLLVGVALIQAPGGAGLVRQGQQITTVDRLRFNRLRPVGPSIRGIGQVQFTSQRLLRPTPQRLASLQTVRPDIRPVSSFGFEGAGTYEVTTPQGVNIRSAPSVGSMPVFTVSYRSSVYVLRDIGNGWVEVRTAVRGNQVKGFMCISCQENPGGPWLMKLQSEERATVPSNPVG